LETTIYHKEIRLRMSKAWNKWRLAGVLCDKIMPTWMLKKQWRLQKNVKY